MDSAVQLPLELRPFRSVVDAYVTAKVKQFAISWSHRLNLGWTPSQLDLAVNETLGSMNQQEQAISNARTLRLVLRHDCQSTGCGEGGCLLCQYNPSRLCKRNLKIKYLIDDHLRAKCGAPLRVELVDDSGACVSEGLPQGTQLEVHVLNGEKYKELCPDNTLLSHLHLRSCVISHHQKALLKREGGSDEQLRCFLQLERGQGPLSDLQVTTSSEALLAGKAPTFRLLVWAVDALGEPVANVTYVVSENFVVATKRVKHAIKSDIPSVADSVSKLVHIGKATVDKLLDLRNAAKEEGFEIGIPDDLNRIEKVGQFQQLVEQSEMNSDLKNKVRHLLKLSPEKWEEVSQHALAAVVPDFRNRVWWCPNIRSGLLFACKNGAVVMEHPIALVKMAVTQGEEDQVIPIHQLDPVLFHTIPKLKQQAVQSWYAASHPGWAIYWKEGQDTDLMSLMHTSHLMTASAPPLLISPPSDIAGLQAAARHPAPSPFAAAAQPPSAPPVLKTGTSASPFATGMSSLMGNISDAFPSWQDPGQPVSVKGTHVATEAAGVLNNDVSLGGGSVLINTQEVAVHGSAANLVNSLNFPSLPTDLLKSDSQAAPGTVWSADPNRSSDWMASGAIQSLIQMQGLASQAAGVGNLASHQQGANSFVAEMEARKDRAGLAGASQQTGALHPPPSVDRSSSLNLNQSNSIDLEKMMMSGQQLVEGASWRNPLMMGFNDSPSMKGTGVDMGAGEIQAAAKEDPAEKRQRV
ncbi:hypothetical protein CEUSTIGMA_g12247.t1 [Chlamydomonas eustigma]|uniref:Uncharacterized protein n=1 Tax=Chlamydomonas eustigma TaxID=1157962 RepID=A0A250XP58_9CHLO|nr:hypothetical protein CEUSTIGMA_g12247.t1 [Chlamydomonas eustigma]|eukprot:GAX84826.1 hypothetical protein CEUSTIGMA_g12247.t1 [Chlamydomonas eustigma]